MLDLRQIFTNNNFKLPSYIKQGCNFVFSEHGDTCTVQKTKEHFKSVIQNDPEEFACNYTVVDTFSIIAIKGDVEIVGNFSRKIREELIILIDYIYKYRHRVYSPELAYNALNDYMESNVPPEMYTNKVMELSKEGSYVTDLFFASDMQNTVGERACLALIKRGCIKADEVYGWEFDDYSQTPYSY